MKLIKMTQRKCAPCGMVAQLLDDRGVDYQTVDVADNPKLAEEYGVMSVPVVILLDDENNELGRSAGFKPDEIDILISRFVR